MLETLLNSPARWLSAAGPDSDVVLSCTGVLLRNLGGMPFPAQCSDDQKWMVEERLRDVFQRANALGEGVYCSLADLDEREALFLAERGLITKRLLQATGPRGVFFDTAQSLCVMVNEVNHVSIQAMSSGLQPRETWARLDELDDAVDAFVDYAYDDRLGYLTADLSTVGTGLRLSAVLHLPGLALANKVGALKEKLSQDWHNLRGMSEDGADAAGDLYRIENRSTLGRSEDELVLHFRHALTDAVAQEREARETIQREGLCIVQDRLGRALGIARGARLLESDEAVSLLSSLRLGIATGLLEGYTLQQLNELLIASQQAHIELKRGDSCDDLTLSRERADLFRARFS